MENACTNLTKLEGHRISVRTPVTVRESHSDQHFQPFQAGPAIPGVELSNSYSGLEIYRVMRFSGIKLGAGINQNW